MDMEEQVVESAKNENNLDLEEDIIPNEDNSSLDNALNDVVQFDYVAINSQPVENTMDSPLENALYGDSGYTQNTDINQMEDISNMVEVVPGQNSGSDYELEEVKIPSENHTPDDDQLDDVIVQ